MDPCLLVPHFRRAVMDPEQDAVYLLYDDFARVNGGLGSTPVTGPNGRAPLRIWTPSGWAIATGVACLSSPTLGDELVQNGGFDSDTTGWTAASSNLASAAGGQAGNCETVTNSTTANGASRQQIAGALDGHFYKVSLYHKNGTSNGCNGYSYFGPVAAGTSIYPQATSYADAASWGAKSFTVRSQAQLWANFVNAVTTANYVTMWDTVSVKHINDALQVLDLLTPYVTLSAKVSRPTTVQEMVGLVWRYKDALNYYMTYLELTGGNGGTSNIVTVQVKAGVSSVVGGPTSHTYAAGKVLQVNTRTGVVTWDAAAVHTATLDSGVCGTKHGMLSTISTCTVDNITAVPA